MIQIVVVSIVAFVIFLTVAGFYFYVLPAVEVDAVADGLILTARRGNVVDVTVDIDGRGRIQLDSISRGKTTIRWSDLPNGEALSNVWDQQRWSATIRGRIGERLFEAATTFNQLSQGSSQSQTFQYTPR